MPDVVAVDGGGAEEADLVARFAENIRPSPHRCTVPGPWGVAIVSRLPVALVDLGSLELPEGGLESGQPVRVVAATVAAVTIDLALHTADTG